MKVLLTVATNLPLENTYLPHFQRMAERDSFGTHFLTTDAADADIITFVDAHQHPNDWRLKSIHQHALTRCYREKTFVYNELDQPWCAIPGLYVSMPKSSFNPQRQRACCYVANVNSLVEDIPNQNYEPDLLFSFVGRRCHRTRDHILNFSHRRAHIEDTSHLHFFGASITD